MLITPGLADRLDPPILGAPAMRRSLIDLFALVSAILTTGPARSDGLAPASTKGNPAAIEYFEKEIRPILANRCFQCHGQTKQKGGLRLDSRKSALTGGNSGPAVVPGKPTESLLIDAINQSEVPAGDS